MRTIKIIYNDRAKTITTISARHIVAINIFTNGNNDGTASIEIDTVRGCDNIELPIEKAYDAHQKLSDWLVSGDDMEMEIIHDLDNKVSCVQFNQK